MPSERLPDGTLLRKTGVMGIVRPLRPDLVRLAEYPVRGVIVTARVAGFG